MEKKRPLVWLSAAYPDYLARALMLQGWRPVFIPLRRLPEKSGGNGMPQCPDARVGIFDTGTLTPDQVAGFVQMLDAMPVQHWVAVLEPHQVHTPETGLLIQRYCTDYHTHPIQSERLTAIIGHLWGMSDLQVRVSPARPDDYQSVALEGDSPAIVRVRDLLERFARIDEPVLIHGENGTGKEAAARYIHEHSRRHDRAMVVVNCAALPASLTQNELFGHEKGAFTHATSVRKGRIEAANGGTLLLMGVDELSPEQQSSILRFLQEGVIERLGSQHSIRVDTRLIATSTRPLEQLVALGTFRSDVFYRLGSLHVHLPPLRERRKDIPTLVNQLLRPTPSVAGARIVTDAALVCLAEHDWPGNLRELQNRLRRAVLLGDGQCIEARDLGFVVPDDSDKTALSLDAFRSRADQEAISVSLALARNNVSAAARLLKISRVSLYRLMEKHQLHYGKAGQAPKHN